MVSYVAARLPKPQTEQNSCRVGRLVAIRREERQRLHQLIALRDWDVAVVEFTGGLAIHVEPPVTLEDGLVEQSGLWTEEALHHQAVVCECTDVKHLQNSTCKSLDKSSVFIINCHHTLTTINSLITILLKNLSTEICIYGTSHPKYYCSIPSE